MTWVQALAPLVSTLGGALFTSATFDHRKLSVRTLVLLGYWALLARYFYWRTTSSIPDATTEMLLVAWLFCGLELGSQLIAQVNYARAAWHYVDRSAEADQHAAWWGDDPPHVAIFIPTYNESREVVSKTITGALSQSYPNFRVWVLDDGKRDWLRAYCADRGVEYVRRANNEHYKSGNLNHALRQLRETTGAPELIAVLDADFVARPTFLSRTVALMHDPRTALVQTPQEFFNPDPIQYAFGSQQTWPDDLRFLFSVRLRGLDGLGNSSCCGTSFLVRRSAIDAIGGFPTESVTEDLLTAVKIGWTGQRCVYLKESLSAGLAAEGLTEHLNQRARWALGLVEVANSAWSPAARSRWPMSWLHRIDFSLRWCLPLLMRHLFLWAPIIAWWTGFSIIQGSAMDAVYYVLPLVAFRLLLVWIEEGANLPVFSDAINLLPSLAIVRSSLGGLLRPGSRPFKVTDKGTRRDGITLHWPLIGYFSAIVALNGFGVLVYHFHTEPVSFHGALGFRLMWSLYDVLVCCIALVPCFERPKYRGSERFATAEPATLRAAGGELPVTLIDLSTSGAAFRSAAPLAVGESARLRVDACPELEGRVVRCTPDGRATLAFSDFAAANVALTKKLYCSGSYIRPAQSWSPARAWGSLLRWAFS